MVWWFQMLDDRWNVNFIGYQGLSKTSTAVILVDSSTVHWWCRKAVRPIWSWELLNLFLGTLVLPINRVPPKFYPCILIQFNHKVTPTTHTNLNYCRIWIHQNNAQRHRTKHYEGKDLQKGEWNSSRHKWQAKLPTVCMRSNWYFCTNLVVLTFACLSKRYCLNLISNVWTDFWAPLLTDSNGLNLIYY